MQVKYQGLSEPGTIKNACRITKTEGKNILKRVDAPSAPGLKPLMQTAIKYTALIVETEFINLDKECDYAVN